MLCQRLSTRPAGPCARRAGAPAAAHVSCRAPPVRAAAPRRRGAYVVAQCVGRQPLGAPTTRTNAQAGSFPVSSAPDNHPPAAPAAAAAAAAGQRPRVVVLGSGWASMSLVSALPRDIKDKYEVVVVSPRNYFLYTPLLPAVAVGTMEQHSVVEPVRNILHGKGRFYEAFCESIDPERKELKCHFPAEAGLDEARFTLKYDLLVVGVGSVNNTLGIKGVREHCFFFKSVEDANALRHRINECFERAGLPDTSEEERKRLLSFVICGGGPTGVEVAAEMHDMIFQDLAELYPELIPDVSIRVVELMDHVLSSYNRKIGEFTAKEFERTGIELLLNTRVAAVHDGCATVVRKDGTERDIPFGACVWATGIAMNPLLRQLQQSFPEQQTHPRNLLTDAFGRMLGGDGSVWAFGDAATVHHPRAADHADELFDQADANKDGKVSLAELRQLMRSASGQYSHLAEHACFLEAKSNWFGGLVMGALTGLASGAAQDRGFLAWHDQLTREEFRTALEKLDSGLRSLPATAQVAKQQGEFMAHLLASSRFDEGTGTLELPKEQGPFRYFHKGALAYVGSDKAVMDVPALGPLAGPEAGLLWRSYEVYAQASTNKKIRVVTDWLRAKVFGRDISHV